MIRVVLRHWDCTESVYIGDFSPHEIDGLLERLSNAPIFADKICPDADYVYIDNDMQGGPLQWTCTKEMRPRLMLEILVTDE